ncbi:MAG: carboxypeptidase-like regulatory domain-containing protein [Bacteroidota bacterium]|nr:carboxypeptidase-like regulatory domain-containing protein [Bacteroidota bacterium]
MNYLRLLLVCCGLIFSFAAQAQSKIIGVALDSVTHEPLAFASVFLASTTLGATTTEKGEFEFPRVPKGTYDIVGSYVGYRLGKQTITVETTPLKITLNLAPTGNQLGEVVVRPAPNNPAQYRQFAELFLGGSTFSEQCHISNPDDVRVMLDDSTQELSARTKEFLQIDNDALGYRLKYYGLYFAYDKAASSITYYGQPVFEEMKPRDEGQRRLWAANRLTAYTGSFMHFLRSLYTNRLAAGSFLTQQIKVVPNPHYENAQKKREALLAAGAAGAYSPAEKDSLRRWSREVPELATLYSEPRPIDSLRRVKPNGRTYMRFSGELQVAHFGEAPDPRFKQPMNTLGYTRTPYPLQRQVSRLQLADDEAEIQADGSLRNPLEVAIGGYWGFEKIGEFLPYDYVPTGMPAPARAPAARPVRRR